VVCRIIVTFAMLTKVVTFVCRRGYDASSIGTVLHHDFETGTTVGYILSHPKFSIHDALLGVPEQFRFQTHPLLIPLLMVERMLGHTSREYDDVECDVSDIEDATGFHGFYEHTIPNNGNADYRQLAKQLGRCTSRTAFCRSQILAAKLVNELCLRDLKSCQSWIPEDKWQDYKETTARLVERAEYNASNIEHALLFRGLEMRLQAQQNVVSKNMWL
jgi:hypothetical protein